MDGSPTSTGKSGQMVCSSDDLQSSSHVRSYTCAFCKRGFSNAQALGGHMNIHRRDRAKLKQAFDENFLSLNIKKSTEEISSTPETPCAPSIEDDCATPRNKASEEVQQLPFIVDEKVGTDHDHEDNKMQLNQATIQAGLDLELRLGSEPHESSTRSSTKEFFSS